MCATNAALSRRTLQQGNRSSRTDGSKWLIRSKCKSLCAQVSKKGGSRKLFSKLKRRKREKKKLVRELATAASMAGAPGAPGAPPQGLVDQLAAYGIVPKSVLGSGAFSTVIVLLSIALAGKIRAYEVDEIFGPHNPFFRIRPGPSRSGWRTLATFPCRRTGGD